MAQIYEASTADSRVGLSYETCRLKTDVHKPKGFVGPPNSIEVKFVVVRNWPGKTGDALITQIDRTQTSPPLPIGLNMKAWDYKSYTVFSGTGHAGVPIDHYTVSVNPGWLLEKGPGGEKFARVQIDKDVWYQTANWGPEQDDIIHSIDK